MGLFKLYIQCNSNTPTYLMDTTLPQRRFIYGNTNNTTPYEHFFPDIIKNKWATSAYFLTLRIIK